MIPRRIISLFVLFALLAFIPSAYAAQSLEELLEQTKTLDTGAAQQNAELERRFAADPEHQAAMLSQAEAQMKALSEASHQLTVQYDANDKQINGLEDQVKTHEGDLV